MAIVLEAGEGELWGEKVVCIFRGDIRQQVFSYPPGAGKRGWGVHVNLKIRVLSDSGIPDWQMLCETMHEDGEVGFLSQMLTVSIG